MAEQRSYIKPIKRFGFWVYEANDPRIRKVHVWVAKAERQAQKYDVTVFRVRIPVSIPDADKWLVWLSSDGILCVQPSDRKWVSNATLVNVDVPRGFLHEAVLDWLPFVS